jgi:hypothetical protein
LLPKNSDYFDDEDHHHHNQNKWMDRIDTGQRLYLELSFPILWIPFDDADSLDDFVVDDEEDEDEFLVDSLRPHRRGLQHGTAFLTFPRPESSLHLLISSIYKTAPGVNVMPSDAGLYRLR